MNKKKQHKDKAAALIIQNRQLDNSQEKIGEIGQALDCMEKNMQSNEELLELLLYQAENHLEHKEIIFEIDSEQSSIIESSMEIDILEVNSKASTIELLDYIEMPRDIGWNAYLDKVESYAKSQNIRFSEDPFHDLMSQSQQITLEKRIREDFSLKGACCDKYDYMIAGTCGLIGGLIDVFLVGSPGQGYLTKFTDNAADASVQSFSKLMGWQGTKEGKDPTASAIGFLERKFKVNYDQATSGGRNGTAGAVKNMSMSNHHLKNLAHSPDLVGLFFSILDQFNSTSHFVSDGKLVSIDTDTFDLKGSNVVAKIFCGFCNWLGHLFSDMAGSSGTRGSTAGRGTGIPIPFYSLLQFVNFGEFGQHRQTFATISVKVFEQGYDLRHGAALAIPVLVSELLTRLMWTVKQRYYHEKPWNESIPTANNPELRRMLLVTHGSLCLIDGADAAIRSNGNMVQFILRLNLIAWVRFGSLGLKEMRTWYSKESLDIDAIDDYLDAEYKRILQT